jgi:DNA-binding transcriptional LysR family regulator
MKQGKAIGNFEFRTLQVFVTTAEQGSMTASADVLGMTQSGVSQTIASLEEAIGRKLFDRSVRPILLTSAGQALLTRGKKILSDVQSAYIETVDAEAVQLSQLSITMPESLANVLGPRLYNRAADLAQQWRISNGLFPDQLSRFNSHGADIMITEESNVSSTIEVERFTILTEPHVLIFPKGFEHNTELGQHLSAAPLIRFSLRSSLGRKTEAQINRLQLKFPEQIEFDSVLAHTRTVADGGGWGITTPMCLFQTPEILDKLIVKPISRGSFMRKMTLVARSGTLGAGVERVANECRNILSQDVLPEIIGRLPWLKEQMNVGDD